MQNKMTRPAAPCATLVGGVAALGRAAATVYGTGKTVQYRNAAGSYVTTASFGELLREAVFTDEDMARAAALLLAGNLPEQGVKTTLILLSALLERGTQAGCAEETWRQVFALLDYGASFTERVAAENGGQVVGGGLTLLTLCRPVRKYAREYQWELAADVVIYGLEQPLLRLAEAAGFDGYAVFERVKALAPNQFFSLHQVGIERSIQVDPTHTDYIRVGLDLEKGTVRDLLEAGVLEDGALIRQVLAFVRERGEALLGVADIL